MTSPKHEWPRRIAVPVGLPDGEREALNAIRNGLDGLGGYIDDFSAALSLYHFSASNADALHQQRRQRQLTEEEEEHRKIFSSWRILAGRDAAMTIYHFGVAAEGIRQTLGLCRTLGETVNHAALRDALKLFREYFPNFEKIRHGVAHDADKLKSPAKQEEHQFSGTHHDRFVKITNSSVTFGGSFHGDSFTQTWEGKILAYELSEATKQKLINVSDAIWNAFPQKSFGVPHVPPP